MDAEKLVTEAQCFVLRRGSVGEEGRGCQWLDLGLTLKKWWQKELGVQTITSHPLHSLFGIRVVEFIR